ncbi:hypothetical protein GCM10010329_80350 [Streptomyces spiroverticillatus]|uniref:Uncharacterized protein n=1 Tax=Streptomyces finlayi TaxID=67296 RepID=A0A918X6X7_9ACTN|nr:hypothetical protein [Streptomyces finlayi]GHA45769.1 hypothetical protein GCM10010329_80350 [Streptomyces spiroverticillatus]GHD15838.1 hypothetical protein GCM10010334_76270 [Streptomyces finlayi]
MEERWDTDEFGASHEGRVGVLLADGSVPKPVYFDGASAYGTTSNLWVYYDGRRFHGPRADALRAVCSCGWVGEGRTLDWEQIGETPLREGGEDAADACFEDWDQHLQAVERAAVPLPQDLIALLEEVVSRIDALTADHPVAGVRAARRLEVLAAQVGVAAHGAAHASPDEVAPALGISVDAARSLLARLGGWSVYSTAFEETGAF